MSDDAGNPAFGITSDNIHLSEVIPAHAGDRANACNPLSLCTDPAVLEFVAAATSPNTLRAYASDLAHFLTSGGSVPSTATAVAQYLARNADRLLMATLARRIVAIRRAHILRGLEDPTKTELVRLTFRGIRRRHGRPQRRVAPLKLQQLADIVSRLGGTTRDVRDCALLLIGFAGAFRRSELCAIDCKSIDRTERGIVVALHRSKTDQEGKGHSVAFPRVSGPLCPVGALNRWLHASHIADGPLFRPLTKDGSVGSDRLSGNAVATIIKRRVGEIGLDPERYSAHSLRAGFATDAAVAGLPVWQIKTRTRHVSDAVLGSYIREIDPFSGIAAVLHAETTHT